MRKDTLLILAALGVGGYLLYKVLGKGAQAASTAYNAARDWTADTFYRWLGPNEAFGPDLFYNVGFPDGTRHAIPSTAVDANSFAFSRQGTNYRMFLGKDGKRYATPV